MGGTIGPKDAYQSFFLFLKITIMRFEGGPLGFDADSEVPGPKA
jgi:hypothetical protein